MQKANHTSPQTAHPLTPTTLSLRHSFHLPVLWDSSLPQVSLQRRSQRVREIQKGFKRINNELDRSDHDEAH